MAEFKIVMSKKDGKCEQAEIKDDQAKPFLGKKIGDKIKGDDIGMPGFEFEISGGSDNCGFPMRKDVKGTVRKRILAVAGTGLKKKRKGQRTRKTVCGNTIHSKISQINLKTLKEGKKKEPEAPQEEAKEEVKEEKKEAPAKEEKTGAKEEVKEEKKEEAPAKEEKTEAKEEVKEEVKEEKKETPAKEEKTEAKEEVKEEKKEAPVKEEPKKEEAEAKDEKKE